LRTSGATVMGVGYLAFGMGWLLADSGLSTAGKHVLALAGFGLGIFAVLAIAGWSHVGLRLDE
jgi:hypothetical protein